MGKAKNLKNRVSSYFVDSLLLEKTRVLVSQIHAIKITVVESELESLLLEAFYIKKFTPRYNLRLTDGKSYPLIRITIKDIYPKILIARRFEDKSSLYFGPYPSSKDVRMVLKLLRRIFPFQNVLHHPKRPCLYYHLGLCPCPEVFNSLELKTHYKKSIRHIIQFLEGKTKQVIKELEKERDLASKNENFEDAQTIQKQINAIAYITSPTHKPFEYELNPNLTSDLREKELYDLRLHLKGVNVNIQRLIRIECFDISNISGKYSVGSMVVFTNGEKDSSQYRRFRIKKTTGIPNDFAAMQEVLARRLKHLEWELPDLLIVDGGKGQISSAQKALKDLNINIPLIGLAKREEIIITSDFKEIKLPRNSESLHLVQRIRDEAHRFAITYHKKLRARSFLHPQV